MLLKIKSVKEPDEFSLLFCLIVLPMSQTPLEKDRMGRTPLSN